MKGFKGGCLLPLHVHPCSHEMSYAETTYASNDRK